MSETPLLQNNPADCESRNGRRTWGVDLARVAPVESPPTSWPAIAGWWVLWGAAMLVTWGGWCWPPDQRDEGLVRDTARVTVLFWALAVGALAVPSAWWGWRPITAWLACARQLWTLGWAAFVVHLVAAFGLWHGWSHRAAVEHVQEVSGFGPGIYISYGFTALWTVDVAWWWLAPTGRRHRPAWVDRILHGFMGFLFFNATVVYETGAIRWVGVAVTAALLSLLAAARFLTPRQRSLTQG